MIWHARITVIIRQRESSASLPHPQRPSAGRFLLLRLPQLRILFIGRHTGSPHFQHGAALDQFRLAVAVGGCGAC